MNSNIKILFTFTAAAILALFYIVDIYVIEVVFSKDNIAMFFVLLVVSTTIMA